MINYIDLSDYIIMKCNKDMVDISNKKLQKIVFYCQAYYVATYKKKLIDNDFEAWVHGAVLPVLYYKYSPYKYNNIIKYDKEEYTKLRKRFGVCLCDFLDKIINKFYMLSADEIEDLNHNEFPWEEARRGYKSNESCNEVISLDSIDKYYSKLLLGEEKMHMENKKISKISINSKELRMAKKRLAERRLVKITEDNKNEYYETVYNHYDEGREYTWRAMNVEEV